MIFVSGLATIELDAFNIQMFLRFFRTLEFLSNKTPVKTPVSYPTKHHPFQHQSWSDDVPSLTGVLLDRMVFFEISTSSKFEKVPIPKDKTPSCIDGRLFSRCMFQFRGCLLS